jgi:hypothetical protein
MTTPVSSSSAARCRVRIVSRKILMARNGIVRSRRFRARTRVSSKAQYDLCPRKPSPRVVLDDAVKDAATIVVGTTAARPLTRFTPRPEEWK